MVVAASRVGDEPVLGVPPAVAAEHDEIQAALEQAVRSGGATGEAALTVRKLLQPHFEKEEQYAMPPLSLLPRLATDQVTGDLRGALAVTRRFREEYPMMLADHRAILAALSDLAAAAEQESKPHQAAFARKLMHHAETEEQVLYPAALLIAKHLELSLAEE
jgi:hypothetical protein